MIIEKIEDPKIFQPCIDNVPIEEQNDETDYANDWGCSKQSVVFLYSNFQYVILCIAFNIAKPFRKPIWTNWALSISIIVAIIYNILLVVIPENSLGTDWYVVVPMSSGVKWTVLLIALSNFVVSWLIEYFIIKKK